MVGRGAFLDDDQVLVGHVQPQPAGRARREGGHAVRGRGGRGVCSCPRTGRRRGRRAPPVRAASVRRPTRRTADASLPMLTVLLFRCPQTLDPPGQDSGPLDALQQHVQPLRHLVAVLVGGQLGRPPGDAAHAVVLQQPLAAGRRGLAAARSRSASCWRSSCSVRCRALASASGSSAVRKPACTLKKRWMASQCSIVGRRSPLMRAPACWRDMPAPSAISCWVYLRPFGLSRVRRSRSRRCRKRAWTSGSPARWPLSRAFDHAPPGHPRRPESRRVVEDLRVPYAQPLGQRGDTGHDGRQQNRRRGVRNLEAIRHRQISYVSLRPISRYCGIRGSKPGARPWSRQVHRELRGD